MLEDSSRFDRLKRDARRLASKLRPRHVVVVVAVAGAAVALASLRTVTLPGPRPVLDGERMQIQVVAPTEPDILPGSVMEVGELADGFEYVPPPPPEAEPAAYAPYDEEFDARDSRTPPKRYAEEAVVHAPPQPEPRERDWRDGRVGRWFGFDAPDRDYRAEREARREQREARMEREREREQGDRERRWYRSDGRPVDDRDREARRYDDGPPPDRMD